VTAPGRLLVALLVLLSLLASRAAAQTQPQSPRVGPNLIANPAFNGTANWLLGSTTYDASQSHTADGTGSIRIQAGARLDMAPRITITAGKQYIFAAYIRTPTWPPGGVNMVVGENNGAGTNINNPESGVGGNGIANTWQEIAMPFTASSTGASVTLIISRAGFADSGSSDIWVDDVYFGEQLGYASPPSAKVPFNGADITVDALGNMQVKKAGVFQNFFPLCIYSDNRRPNNNGYQLLSDQGFNCDTWGGTESLDAAAAAVSTFNPDGLMSGIGYQVQHTMNQGGLYWDAAGTSIANFTSTLRAHARFHTHFLWYYWDNENVWDQWNNQMTAANQWKAGDTVGGQRTHPFYGLQGSYNATRMYHNPANGQTCCDMSGTYTTEGNTGGAGHAGGQSVMWNIEGQTFPVVIEQWNGVHRSAAASDLRRVIYTHLLGGAKGFGFWRDCYPDDCGGLAAPVDQVAWWPDVPNIRREIESMLPMLRQPHWTSWTVSFNTALPINVGTRDYNGKGHLLVVNTSAAPVTVTFTLSGFPYTPQSVQNYFTGGVVTSVSGQSFTVTIPALGINSGTAVYAIAGTASTVPSITSPLTASATQGSAFSYQITATNAPTSYGATSLPLGLSVNMTTGLISGTPTGAGTFNVDLSASNASGTGSATLVLSISLPPLAPQLYVHWTFNEGMNATAGDTGTCNCPGTIANAPTWSPGREGPYSLTFAGTNQYVTNSTFAWPAAQPVTVALWVKTAGGTVAGAFGVGGSATNRFGAHIPYADNILYWQYGVNNAEGSIGIDYTPYLNQWTHVALVSNGVSFRAIYLNGVRVTSNTVAQAALPNLSGLDVARYALPPYETDYQSGSLDDFRLYTSVLSDSDIQALYLQAIPRIRHKRPTP
jgi:Concanavalin A-like lectin/glucanases superfamily/Putative Ig domain